MHGDTFRNTADFLARQRRRRVWRRIVGVLSCVVALCITYALILPARSLEKAAGEPAASTTPLALGEYINGAVLSYRTDPNGDWQAVDAGTKLPGDAELKLEISYHNVHVDALRDAGLQITYTLPGILRAPTGTGQINDDGNRKMGTMTVENGVVTLTFDEEWLNTHHSTTENDVISGKFHVQSQIDLTMAGEHPSLQITVGGVTIDLNFAENIVAQYADVTLQKTDPVAVQNADGDYLQYTLTVTAGEDGAPDVVVKDAFPNRDQALAYMGISEPVPAGSDAAPVETGAPEGRPGQLSMDGDTMVWTVGDMAPGETRTLTYRVKMQKGYLGGSVKEPIVNSAELFCDIYSRGKDTGTFTPTAKATMSKTAAEFRPDPDGGGTITYTVWIHAEEENTYTLTNVRIWDALDGSIDRRNATDAEYLPYLSFVQDAFRLYQGGHEDQNGDEGLTNESQITPVFQNKADGTTNTHFISCDVGSLAPGESKTLIYTLKVDPGVFPAAGNAVPKIHNRAQLHAGDAETGNEAKLNSFNENVNIEKKTWSSKLPGTKQETAVTVSVSGDVYAADGSRTENTATEFTAPAGSYRYQVSVNPAGDWDVSGVSMTDRLLGGFSKYIGYARVDAYSVDASGNQTLTDTVWLFVDGRTSFSFTPSSVGWAGKQAYTLTYYTHVEIPAGAPQVNVENGFTMTGDVGIGGKTYTLTGAYVSASNIIQGSNSFTVSKHGWYYEPSKVTEGEYANGAIYWYIQVKGNEIPANTYLQDITSWNTQYMYNSSLVGLYTGNLGDRTVADYDDLKDLLASGKLTRLESSGYSFETTGKAERFPTMTVRLLSSVPLSEGESLFLIVKIEPHENPADLTGDEHYTYKNEVKSSYDGSNWVAWGDPQTMVIYGSNGISKTLEKVSNWNGTVETVVTPAEGTAAPDALAGLESGTYVFWKVQLNYPGNLHGSYCVEERIPDGMKLAYVECTGVGGGYGAEKPSCVQRSVQAGWTECRRNTTYYYTNGQTARWYVDGLQTGGTTHTVDFLVVCRVTDGDVLLGGTEKTFQNQVKLLRESGKLIDSDSSPVTLQAHTLHKEGTYSPETDSTKFPFVITLNPLGEDLVPGASTVSLVDTLSGTLKLDISSIRVTQTGTDTPVTGWRSSVDGQTLTLTLPDQMPLTVTYSAWINAKPGDHIAISNNAHWEGYPTPPGGAVDNENFEFDISGSASSSESPSITITKLDENDLSLSLAGAEFILTEAAEVGGTITEKPETSWTGTTDGNGVLTFGEAEHQTMEFNTVYCLRETKAPDGYVLDGTPHYFTIAKKVMGADGTEAYPTFPAGVYVHYLGSAYSYQAFNRKGQITVQKTFADPGGNDCGPVVGSYTFGLYKTADGSGTPESTVTISYSETDTAADRTAVFRDLPLDQTYYVFELDAEGKPILGGDSLSDRFTVTYRYSEGADCAALTAENGEQTVTVTNRVHTPELPETGGTGTTVFYAIGWILFAGAAALLFGKKRPGASRRRKFQ